MRLLKFKSEAGIGSGVVIGENLVLSVSHNFIKDVPDGNNRKVADNIESDKDVYTVSYEVHQTLSLVKMM